MFVFPALRFHRLGPMNADIGVIHYNIKICTIAAPEKCRIGSTTTQTETAVAVLFGTGGPGLSMARASQSA
jgi:hypothetical protein